MSDSETSGGTPTPPAMPPGEPPREAAAPAPSPEEAGSLAANLAGVILSPGRTFRRILARPGWLGALAVYIAVAGIAALVYSLNVDWEAMYRGQFEDSLMWQFLSSTLSEEQMENVERGMLNEILSTGKGGMALTTTLETIRFGTFGVHLMAILFATLFYLMGSFGDLKLGRVYLDGFLCFLLLLGFALVGGFLRSVFGADARQALPYQAGLIALSYMAYLWLLYRSVERQPAFRRLMSVYCHAMAVPAVAALLSIVVILMHQGPVTVAGGEVLKSNLGALLAMEGTGFLTTLASSLDIFRLWELAVAGIGFAAASRLSLGASLSITFLPWGFLTMARLALALVFGG